MRDGQDGSIVLVGSQQNDSVTYYSLQVTSQDQKYVAELRYSQLRLIAQQLPQADCQFPRPHRFGTFLSALTHSQRLREHRYRGLRQYLAQVSNSPALTSSAGFNKLLALSQQLSTSDEDICPQTPYSKPRKLTPFCLPADAMVVQ